MKKSWRAAAACALAGVMVAAGCGGDGNTGSGLAPEGELMTYTEYNLDTYVRPYWHTREIYNEILRLSCMTRRRFCPSATTGWTWSTRKGWIISMRTAC